MAGCGPTSTICWRRSSSPSRREHGNHPFGSLLVDGDGNVLFECENTTVTERDSTGHAELNVIREASKRFDSAFLGRCTVYASTEPCAMCAGAIFWAGVRRVVFALSTDQLLDMLGGNPDGPTLKFSCREVFARVNQEVEVSGPHLLEQARAPHEDFWT